MRCCPNGGLVILRTLSPGMGRPGLSGNVMTSCVAIQALAVVAGTNRSSSGLYSDDQSEMKTVHPCTGVPVYKAEGGMSECFPGI